MGGAFSWGGATLRARRGAAAEFGCSLRNVSCQAQMNILLWPPPLLLLLAALVAQATAATTYRPDWNRLRGLARGRVEVSAPFPILSRIAPEPLSPSTLEYSSLWSREYQNSRGSLFPSCVAPGIIPSVRSHRMRSMHCGSNRRRPCGLAF